MKKIRKGLLLFFLCGVLFVGGCGSDRMSKQEYRMAGIEALEAGSYEEAVRLFDEAIAHSNGFVGKFELDVLKYRAEAEFSMEDYASSAETYQVLLEADKEREEYYYFLCMAQAKAGNLDDALEAFEKGEAIENETTKNKTTKNKKDNEESADNERNGRDEARLLLGAVLKEQGRAEEAVAIYEEAVSSGSASPELYNQLGLSYLESGSYENAVSAFENGISALTAGTDIGTDTGTDTEGKEDSCRQELLFNQAVSYEFCGEFARARELMEQYVAVYPDDENAKRELTFLKTR